MTDSIMYEPLDNEEEVLARLRSKWDIADGFYARIRKKMILLDATDKGDLWKVLEAKFPSYQIMPDTNFISNIKINILASIYTVCKSAELVPTDDQDEEICLLLSSGLEHIWDVREVGWYQFQAGERAALLNLGLTYGTYDADKDDVVYQNVDPMKYIRDPYARDLETAGYQCMFDNYHKSVFESNAKYKERFKKFKDSGDTADTVMPEYPDRPKSESGPNKDHFNLRIWFERDGEKINEYHTLDDKFMLFHKLDIKPSMFPIVELYCNLPGTSLIGSSEPAKVFANNMAYNLMNSIAFTAEYKNQRPPKFISSSSGLNIKTFSQHGDQADKTFIVNGDASKAVHYQQFPFISPALPNMISGLQFDIQDTSGIDKKYTGRDSGSLQTTGGMEQMLQRVTLVDGPKVICYEKYAKELSKLTLELMLEYAPKRTYYIKDELGAGGKQKWKALEIDFPDIKAKHQEKKISNTYAIQISSELPKNKQRVSAWANMMMEKQMQYAQEGNNVDLITNEEWIRMQDVPYKEQMLQRMGIQKEIDSLEMAGQVITEYAGMLKAGYNPNDAMVMAAQGLDARKQGAATPFEEVQQQQQQNPLAGGGSMGPMAGI